MATVTPGEVESLDAPGGSQHGDSATHRMLSGIRPALIREDDIYRVEAEFRTVLQVLHLRTGETVLYFRAPYAGRHFRVKLAVDAPGVVVYRPRRPTWADA